MLEMDLGVETMGCDDVRDLRIEWLRGRLPADRTRELDGHLAGCAACRALMEAERRLDQILDRAPGMAVPEGFALRVLTRIARRVWRLRAVRWGAAIAAALLVAFLANTAGDVNGLSPEEREIVEHLDLLENLPVVETADLMDEPSAADDIDLAADLGEELY